ncbi:MAG TPA: SCO family protein, partial [Chitinophagaceae bacterium]|nr:SCO family protein [Chitinophagaceae bacterium]
MNKKAFYAILLAVALPLLGYFFIKRYGETAIVMPPHYFMDTVITKTVKGKKIQDTVWQKIPDFSLVNQQGDSVSW